MGCCSCCRIIGLLLIKNFVLQFRSWIFTLFELILPVAYIAVLVALRYQFFQIQHPERRWEQISINNVTNIEMDIATVVPMVFPFGGLADMKKIVVFSPDNEEVRNIATRFKNMGYFFGQFIDVEYRKNESEMINYLDSKKNESDPFFFSKYLGGISINKLKKANGTQFGYKIHFDNKLRPGINVSKLEELLNVTSVVALLAKLENIKDLKNDKNLTKAIMSPKG